MPHLKDFRVTKTITLPSFPDSKVEIYSALLVGQLSGINWDAGSTVKLAIERLPLYIKSWNFTNDKEEPLEINQENIGFLKEEDLVFLVNQIQEFEKETKKKSENSSPSATS